MTNIYCIETKKMTIIPVKTKKEGQSMGNGFCVAAKPEDLEKDRNLTLSSMAELYNSFEHTENIKKFSDKKSAARRLWAAIEKSYEGHKKEVSPKRGKRDIPLKINTHLEMPFRKGSKSGDAWELIKSNPGKTFNEYVALGARANTIAGAIRNEWLVQAPVEGN